VVASLAEDPANIDAIDRRRRLVNIIVVVWSWKEVVVG
jgi:hypothetical protein